MAACGDPTDVPVPATDVAALPPFLQALAEQALTGDPLAQHDLAVYYAAGELVEQDLTLARQWFALAAKAPIGNARFNLAMLIIQGQEAPCYPQALNLLRSASELGHPKAPVNLNLIYRRGLLGVEADAEEAERWAAIARAAATRSPTQQPELQEVQIND